MTDLPPIDRSRRLMLAAAGGMAVAPLLASATAFAADLKSNGASSVGSPLPGQTIGRRRFGGLEVSSVGLDRVNGFETRAKEASFFKEAMSRADGIAMLLSCSA